MCPIWLPLNLGNGFSRRFRRFLAGIGPPASEYRNASAGIGLPIPAVPGAPLLESGILVKPAPRSQRLRGSLLAAVSGIAFAGIEPQNPVERSFEVVPAFLRKNRDSGFLRPARSSLEIWASRFWMCADLVATESRELSLKAVPAFLSRNWRPPSRSMNASEEIGVRFPGLGSSAREGAARRALAAVR